jgi:hypothetical protein
MLANLKKTNREKDYAVIGELARRMEDGYLQALHSRSARDLVQLAAEHPAAVARAAIERPLLSRIGEGREPIERLLDEERRTLIRQNEDRLERYLAAATPWAAGWARLAKELAGRPLPEAHAMMVARAAELLPREP